MMCLFWKSTKRQEQPLHIKSVLTVRLVSKTQYHKIETNIMQQNTFMLTIREKSAELSPGGQEYYILQPYLELPYHT